MNAMRNSAPATTSVESSHSRQPAVGRRRLWQLEAVRGIAALYVLLYHTSNNYLGLNHVIWALPFRFGLEAVLVFFVLSGFVISYSHPGSADKADNFRNYFIKRLRRIYPIFILSLALAYGISCLNARSWAPLHISGLLGNVFMLQNSPAQPGVSFLPFDKNAPLWSLAYEWWFYMLFYPINRFVPRSLQKFVVIALSLIGMGVNLIYPNAPSWYLVFFIIWWWGVELAHEFRESGNISFFGQRWMFALFALPFCWYAVIAFQWWRHGHQLPFNNYPLFDLRHFLMTPLLIILVLAWKRARFVGFDSTLGRFQWLGGISYAIYVFHFPLICDLRLFGGRGTIFYLDLVLRIALAFALAWLAEGIFQKWINRITAPLLKPNRTEIKLGRATA